jgi:hypothetical protein
VEEEWVREKVEGIEQEEEEEEESDDEGEGDEDAIEDRYEPSAASYPATSIFEKEFLENFWESESDPSSVGAEVTTEMLREVEQQLGFKLPASYIELIRFQNGGRPNLKSFLAKNSEETTSRVDIEELMGCDGARENSLIGGSGSEFFLEEWEYPRIGIYFGSCPSGGHDMICLDYRKCGVAGEPEVTHVDQELDFQKVVIAPNFETFVRGLIPSDELEE